MYLVYFDEKKEEQSRGISPREIDRGGIKGIEPLLYKGEESMQDVLAWVAGQKKGAARG